MRGPRAWVIEFVGTLMFVTVGAGSVVVNNSGIAPMGLIGVAAAHGLVLAIVVTGFAHASGAHVNPAVTISLLIGGRIRLNDAVGYIVAQVAGSIAAGGLLVAMLSNAASSDRINVGTPGVGAGIGAGRAVFIEGVFAFFLVIAVWATVVDERGAKVGGFGVGMMLFAGMLIAAQPTGGVLNPARHVGPAIVSGAFTNWWVYWVGPVSGGIVAGLVYPILLLDRRFPWRLVPSTETEEPAPRKSTRRG